MHDCGVIGCWQKWGDLKLLCSENKFWPFSNEAEYKIVHHVIINNQSMAEGKALLEMLQKKPFDNQVQTTCLGE